MKTTKVTPETNIRAETDFTFFKAIQMAGGVNRLFHFRNVTPLSRTIFDRVKIIGLNSYKLYNNLDVKAHCIEVLDAH